MKDVVNAAPMGLALMMSTAAALALTVADLSAYRKLEMTRQVVVESPSPGSLAGQIAHGDQEWAPQHPEKSRVLLFVVAADGKVGDLKYWTEVALQLRIAAPGLQLVGVCSVRADCVIPPAAPEALTLLGAMDPMQMRALAIASSEGRGFMYDARGVRQTVELRGDKNAVMAAISRAFSRQPTTENL